MRNHMMHYPGDPPTSALEMTVEEFLSMSPDRSYSINGKVLGTIPEIICDCCNTLIDDGSAKPSGTPQMWVVMNRGYCLPCADEWIKPYVLGTEAG